MGKEKSIINIAKSNEKGEKKPGNDLLSHGQAAVPSAKKRFTVVFGMGTCVSTSLWSPGNSQCCLRINLSKQVKLFSGTKTIIWSSLTAY